MSARNASRIHALNLEHPAHNGVTVEIVTVTPDLAAEWLGTNHGNRNQRPGKINQYVRDLVSGNWVLSTDAIGFDWDGRLINGQHRCEAAVESGESFPAIVVRGLDPRAQDVMDQGAKRSAADALRFNGVSGYATIIAAVANIAVQGGQGKISRFGDMGKAFLSNSEVIDWFAGNRDVEHSVAFASRIARKIKATPAPLAYAIYRTEQIDPEKSFTFFDDLSEFRTHGKGDPIYALLDGLRRLDERAAHKPAGSQLAHIFRAWNAYRDGRRLNHLGGAYSDSVRGRVAVSIPEPK